MTEPDDTSRAYSSAHFMLELDQKESVGFIRSVEGGGLRSETMAYRGGDSHAVYRQQGAPKYEDLKLQVGMSMSRSFYTWIEGFFSGELVRKNGAIVAANFKFKERARRTFSDALISEVTMPKFDGQDRSPCYMGVTLVPETVRYAIGSGAALDQATGIKQKLWTPNRFEFAIDGFESSTRRTTKVDSFTIKQQVHECRTGEFRDPIKVPGRIDLPNLTFYVPEADAKPLIDHFTKTVVGGNRAEGRMTAHLTLKDNDRQPLCTIEFSGVEIASIGADKSDATAKEIKQVKVEIAIEGLKFRYTADGVDV